MMGVERLLYLGAMTQIQHRRSESLDKQFAKMRFATLGVEAPRVGFSLRAMKSYIATVYDALAQKCRAAPRRNTIRYADERHNFRLCDQVMTGPQNTLLYLTPSALQIGCSRSMTPRHTYF
jgi:hypothetical protein